MVVAGGGFSGCDCAIELAQEGKEVTVVEMMDKLVPKANIAAAISVNRTIREQGRAGVYRHKGAGVLGERCEGGDP